MSWIVTLKIVDCASMSTLLPGTHISSALLDPPGYVVTDANGQAQIFDAYDLWEWVNLTISKSGNGGPCDASYHPGYTSKNFVINMSMDGTVQTVCLNKAPPAVCDPDAPTTSCFIVSAATGSTTSFEVTELRALRDRVRATSRLSAELIEAIYAEYERFSPPIAAELHEDAATRGVVLSFVVRPLFAWYRLAGTLALDLGNQSARLQEAQLAVAEACPPDALADAEMIVGFLEALRGSAPLPAGLPPLLRELAPRIAEITAGPFAVKHPPDVTGEGYVVRSIEAALWAFHRSDSFRDGALLAVNLGDDADTTGAIYGQIAGAFHGERGIPAEWRAKLALREEIESFADSLLELRAALAER